MNRTEFDAHIKNPCIVDFYTTGCPVCEKLAPVFEDLSEHCDSRKFLKVNLDDDITLAASIGTIQHFALVTSLQGKAYASAICLLR